jgi:hypothetical protein
MISKKELLDGLELLYTGKSFAGFQEENPFVTFLRLIKTTGRRSGSNMAAGPLLPG